MYYVQSNGADGASGPRELLLDIYIESVDSKDPRYRSHSKDC